MSEYWKSTPKYWCKHCSIYVKDTPFERKQHENTGKHQGNLKRFLRGIQNDHERNEREKNKAKDEVERLNRVVTGNPVASMASSMASNKGTTSSARASTATNLTAADQKRQWAQLADMGIQVPENFRAEMAMAGTWQTVTRAVEEDATTPDSLSKGIRKRKYDDEDEEVEDASNMGSRRGWGSTTKRYPGSKNDDVDSLLTGSSIKPERTAPSTTESEPTENAVRQTSAPTAENDGDTDTKPNITQTTGETKDDEVLKTSDIKLEESTNGLGVLISDNSGSLPVPVFKKRKAKAK